VTIGLEPRAQPPLERTAAADSVILSAVSRALRDGRGRELPVLERIDLRVGPGEVVAVVGPSGCGKTTLLELICGLQAADGGRVRSAPAALMAQADLLLPWMCALDNAALALRLGGLDRARARARARPLFAELGLAGFEAARPHELSGGMRQRVAFLRTLLSGKPVLCLDEPFGALDAITRQEMQGWLARALRHQSRSVVLVTHDVEEAVLLGDRVVVLGPRPARVAGELDVGVERPRSRTGAAEVALRERALQLLSVGGQA
jgi:ABC-type nitrate/sulfonate/bicarbonate transport system ATPase subunit